MGVTSKHMGVPHCLKLKNSMKLFIISDICEYISTHKYFILFAELLIHCLQKCLKPI